MKRILLAYILCASTTFLSANDIGKAINHAAQTALQPLLNSSQLLENTQTLEAYNQGHFWQPIPIDKIEKFLDEQVIAVGLNPRTITYVVGQELKLFKTSSNAYVLIIPDAQPTLIESYKIFIGEQAAPAYPWNIESIAKLVRNRNDFSPLDYDTCCLTIRKALIEPFSLSITAFSRRFMESIPSIVLHAAQAFPAKVNSYHAMIAEQLIAQINAFHLENSLEIALDSYVISARDIGLLNARIKELEDIVASRSQSFIGKSRAWVQKNILSSAEDPTVENRLAFLKSFLNQHRQEL